MGLSPEALNRIIGDGANEPVFYNCSQSGCLPIGLFLNLNRLLDGPAKPEYVLIEVLPPVLADRGPMEQRIPILRLNHADLNCLEPYFENPRQARIDWASARAASWCTLRYSLLANWKLTEWIPSAKGTTHHLWANMTFLGWGPFSPPSWSDEQRAAQMSVAHGSYGWLLDRFEVQPINDRLYRDMLNLCRSRGVKAALFTMPESPTFRSWYRPAAKSRVVEFLNGLATDCGVPLFHTSAWIEDEKSFMDGHHLFHDPAVAFSERLGRECIVPWLQGK